MGRTIFVTNTNDFHHTDRYDGEDYEFPPGEKVAITEEAATHMFGRNLVDKSNALQRLGWAMKYDPATKNFEENLEGARNLARFVFTESMLVEALGRPSVEPEIA